MDVYEDVQGNDASMRRATDGAHRGPAARARDHERASKEQAAMTKECARK